MALSEGLDTTTLSTKLEENFVSPLTAVRGALEILRDFPDLDPQQHKHFVVSALDECARLERGVEELASAVYSAGRNADAQPRETEVASAFTSRIRIDDAAGIVEVDFSDFEFRSADLVNDFFDAIEGRVSPTGKRWYFMTNFQACSVWPEAWVAFAHRGKKISVQHALGTVRYSELHAEDQPDICASRAEALAKIEAMKADQS